MGLGRGKTSKPCRRWIFSGPTYCNILVILEKVVERFCFMFRNTLYYFYLSSKKHRKRKTRHKSSSESEDESEGICGIRSARTQVDSPGDK